MDQKKIKNSSILYVEDDTVTREQLSHFLMPQCQVLYVAKDGQEGFELYKRFEPNIVILDIEMPGINGLELAKKIRQLSLSTQIIVITAYQNTPYLLEAVNLQLVQYLLKPISLDKISNALTLALDALKLNGFVGEPKGGVLIGNRLKERVTQSKKMISLDMHYNTYTKELIEKNKTIDLSKYERSLIELLIDKHPAPVPYESIDAHIYNYGASKNAIKLLVSSLRDKVSKKTVANISGFGYRMNLMGDK